VSSGEVIEHGSSRNGRWLKARRVKIALWIAVVEGILIIIGAIGRWPSLIVAVLLVALYFGVGRNLKSDTLRQASWIVAASQALVALVPVFWTVVKAAAIVVVALVAVLALVVLFTDRK
jgi:hypothetical protein